MTTYRLNKLSLTKNAIAIFFLLAMVKVSQASNMRTLKNLKDPNYQIQQLTKQGVLVDGTAMIQGILDKLSGPGYDKKCKEREERIKELVREKLSKDPIIEGLEKQKQTVKEQMKIQVRQQRVSKFFLDTTSTTEIKQDRSGSLPDIKTIDEAIEGRKQKIREDIEKDEPPIEEGGMIGDIEKKIKESENRQVKIETEEKEERLKRKLERERKEKKKLEREEIKKLNKLKREREAHQKNGSGYIPVIWGLTIILSMGIGYYSGKSCSVNRP